MTDNEKWNRYIHTVYLENRSKRVKEVEFNLIGEDFEGDISFTDLQLQEGTRVSGTMPELREILSPVEFNIDENTFLRTVSNPVKRGTQPQVHNNIKNRFFNIIGRGHEVVSIPNVFHENYSFPVITTGLDLELRAKEDFDLLRIRTNDGNLIEGRQYSDVPQLENHPLNYKYTREFYFSGAKAGELIELKASINSAKINNKSLPFKNGSLKISGEEIAASKQRVMLAPEGSFRIGIEFYKKVTETFEDEYGFEQTITYFKDVGIGFYGIAEFNQWTYGGSKL